MGPEVSADIAEDDADLVSLEPLDENGEALPQEVPASATPADEGVSVASQQQLEADAADRLVIRFKEVCWLRVRDLDGEELYVGQRDENQPLQLDGRGPFRITLGNVAAVSEIIVNDTSVRVPVVAPGQVITVRAP